jgi:hypothetical protein
MPCPIITHFLHFLCRTKRELIIRAVHYDDESVKSFFALVFASGLLLIIMVPLDCEYLL